MFIIDSLFLSGFRWVLDTVRTAAESEMDDEAALRDQLMAAELRRELGEMSDEEFAAIEADVLARIRGIRERREGGSQPIAFGRESAASGEALAVEATVSGDFHQPPASLSDTAGVSSARPRTRTVRAARKGRSVDSAGRRRIRKS